MTASSSLLSSPALRRHDVPSSDTPIDYFPEEVIELVLSKCPVKSVVRFKSVSKSWQSIVSDPRFAKTHRIQRSKLPENENKYILLAKGDEMVASQVYMVIESEEEKNKIFNIESVLPYPSFIINLAPLSSCNGLILSTPKGNNINQHYYMLWNPSIRKHTIITWPRSFAPWPLPKWQEPHLYYDSTTDDHKIVFYNERSHTVYSCNKGSWSGMNDFPNYHYHGRFFDGCFYSIDNGKIVCFDTRDGNLHKFRQPDKVGKGEFLVGELSERLYLFNLLKDDDAKISTWAMEKRGSFEKWVWDKDEDESMSSLYDWKLFNMEKEKVADLMVLGKVCYVKYNGLSRGWCHDHEARILPYSETLYMP